MTITTKTARGQRISGMSRPMISLVLALLVVYPRTDLCHGCPWKARHSLRPITPARDIDPLVQRVPFCPPLNYASPLVGLDISLPPRHFKRNPFLRFFQTCGVFTPALDLRAVPQGADVLVDLPNLSFDHRDLHHVLGHAGHVGFQLGRVG